jgi:molybdopterin/thiamine biosynthesis adenylyltransferase
MLKQSMWERCGDTLVAVTDPSKQIELEDPTGQVETLLSVLSAGPQSVDQVRRSMEDRDAAITGGDLLGALDVLDSLGLLEEVDSRSLGASSDERFHSNLAFFGLFANRARSRVRLQRRVIGSHVLQLGTGGVGASVVQHLAGLGIGWMTLLDFDRVEPSNFARQYVYRHMDIGKPKVHRAAEWVRDYDPRIQVDVVEQRVAGPDDVAVLLHGVDVVSAAIDRPPEVDDWVNEACVRAGVPWVRGGIQGSRLGYFSVNPGQSACFACCRRMDAVIAERCRVDAVASRLAARVPSGNRAIGPVAGLLGSLMAFELLRYLTEYEPPTAAGASIFLDASDQLAHRRQPWTADPECALCQQARERLALPATGGMGREAGRQPST